MEIENQTPARKLLDPSELGTKEYWEAAYTRELSNNETDVDDEGIIWFDESNAEDTVLKLLASYTDEDRGLLPPSTSFLDLGTGNGHMLFALREDDSTADGSYRWTEARLVGVDYSPKSIELAQRLDAQRREADDSFAEIQFEQWDLLAEDVPSHLETPFDVVLDKGTFDAISLMPHGDQVHPCEVYRGKVVPLIKAGKFLVITSCNWTKMELIEWLAPSGGELEVFDEASYPTFTFGGQTGQSVVTLVFRRRGD